jgi:hypothetical protein
MSDAVRGTVPVTRIALFIVEMEDAYNSFDCLTLWCSPYPMS